jgi:hypothetical protein
MDIRRPFLFAVFALLAALPAGAQWLLPTSFAGWGSAQGATIGAGNIQRIAGDNAAVLREYGVLDAEQRLYARGPDSLRVILYRMHDPSGAYGAYSFLRAPDMTGARLSEHSSMSRGRALVLTGNLLLDISGKDLVPLEADLKALVGSVAPHAESGPYPFLWQRLPLEGIVPGSDRYLLGPVALNQLLPASNGDWLGFSEGAEAELARYRLDGQEVTLLLADYPTPQAAAKKLQELSSEFGPNSAAEHGRPRLFARRNLTLIAVVANARSDAVAQSLLKQVSSGTELTWNEPSFSLTDPGIGQMVVGTIIGTGVLCLFTLIAGLAFGGVRLTVKRLMPGRVFDRPATMEILQLGLSSKPIQAKDFYSRFEL